MMACLAFVSQPLCAAAMPDRERQTAGAGDLPDLKATVDGHVRAMMQARGVAGAAIVVVHRGQIVYAQGYGASDAAGTRPYDPGTTVAQLFSVSKPVSTLAILQQAQLLGLDLDKDVNAYLKTIQLPPGRGAPVTLRRLLSHSAGLSDNFRNEVALGPHALRLLPDHLADQPPRRRMPSGALVAYSNNAVQVAALAVADASGLTYEQILRERLTRPAATHQLISGWPGNAIAAGRLARLHQGTAPGRELPRFATNPAPAGGLFATPLDVGRILILLLESGRIDGRTVISKAVIDQMLTPQAAAAPGMSANGLGIRLHRMGGRRFAEHAGENRNAIMMLPDERFGIYLVTTRHSDAEALYPTFRAIAGRWFPLSFGAAPAPRPAGPVAHGHAGLYIDARLVEGVVWRLGAAFAKPDTAGFRPHKALGFDRDGVLTFDGARFAELEPTLFRALEKRYVRTGELEQLKLAVLPDGRKVVTLDMAGMLQLSWYQQPLVVRSGLGLLSVGLVLATFMQLRRPDAGRTDKVLAILSTAAALALPIIAFLYFRSGDRFIVERNPQPILMSLAPWLPLVALVLCILLAGRAWLRKDVAVLLYLAASALMLGGLAVATTG